MRQEPAYGAVTMVPMLPADLRDLIGGEALWESVTIGHSGVSVFQITSATHGVRYLKIAEGDAGELMAEGARLEWLAGRLPAPHILYSLEADGRAFLLMCAVPGYVTCDPRVAGDLPRVVRLLAGGMRMMHALDWSGCPFDARLDAKIAAARERVARGQVDEDDFDAIRLGRTGESLLADLITLRPPTEDLVFTHGDYCLPNILIDAGGDEITGFIDLGRAGVADRYQDIALAARSLEYNFGSQWVPLLFDAYGLDPVDHAKIAYYQLLDEFF
jgi:aminoglycoside phosphotransferase